jgi:hypothetical protein
MLINRKTIIPETANYRAIPLFPARHLYSEIELRGPICDGVGRFEKTGWLLGQIMDWMACLTPLENDKPGPFQPR